jgi:DTW domain-containing protein YfiP
VQSNKPIHLAIDEVLRTPFVEFSRSPSWKGNKLKCDCAGLITLLYQKVTGREYLKPPAKAIDYFHAFKKEISGSRQPNEQKRVMDFKKYDVLCWKKQNPPKTGDTGHLLILLSRPKKITDTSFQVKILEVNQFNGLEKRCLTLHSFVDGRLKGIAWHPNTTKVKVTEIVVHSLFKEKECPACEQPSRHCLCSLLPKEKKTPPPFHIIRHRDEAHHPLGTVKLLEKYYRDLNVIDSENIPKITGTLIYPQTEDGLGAMVNELPEGPLIFIDATWKKSFRILQENPWLKDLKRYSIEDRQGQYKIRKAPQSTALSTIEAFSYCLMNGPLSRKVEAQELETIFRKFIAGKMTFIGEEKLNLYYS